MRVWLCWLVLLSSTAVGEIRYLGIPPDECAFVDWVDHELGGRIVDGTVEFEGNSVRVWSDVSVIEGRQFRGTCRELAQAVGLHFVLKSNAWQQEEPDLLPEYLPKLLTVSSQGLGRLEKGERRFLIGVTQGVQSGMFSSARPMMGVSVGVRWQELELHATSSYTAPSLAEDGRIALGIQEWQVGSRGCIVSTLLLCANHDLSRQASVGQMAPFESFVDWVHWFGAEAGLRTELSSRGLGNGVFVDVSLGLLIPLASFEYETLEGDSRLQSKSFRWRGLARLGRTF